MCQIITIIISILTSLVIPVIWLALSSVIYSRITLFRCKARCNSLFISAFQQTRAASSIKYWYLWLFFITFVVGITFMVDFYCFYGQCYVYARENELRERLPAPYDNYLESLSPFSLCLWSIITIMGDTSLYVLSSQCSSCDKILGNCFIQITSLSRAYVRMIYEQTKGKNPLRPSRGRQNIQVKEVYYEWF